MQHWTPAPPFPVCRFPFLVVLGMILVPTGLQAQLPFPTPPPQRVDTTGADTIKVPAFRVPPPVPPLAAMARSLLLPGWGQSVLHRRVTGAVFVFWEGVTLTMTVKASHQLALFRQVSADTAKIAAKKQEVQDWAVLLAFNHLLAAAEAYVSALLWDFPAEVDLRPLPGGGVAAGLRVRF